MELTNRRIISIVFVNKLLGSSSLDYEEKGESSARDWDWREWTVCKRVAKDGKSWDEITFCRWWCAFRGRRTFRRWRTFRWRCPLRRWRCALGRRRTLGRGRAFSGRCPFGGRCGRRALRWWRCSLRRGSWWRPFRRWCCPFRRCTF